MKKIDLTKIKTERDLQLALMQLDRRWKTAFSIRDPKKRGREILRLRNEIKYILDHFKRHMRHVRTANLNYNDNDNLFNKIFKSIVAWLRKIEKKDRDAQRKIQNN